MSKWPGLIIVGTEGGCGKTVATAGLAATLRENGCETRAVKPIVMGKKRHWEAELGFLSLIAHTPVKNAPVVLERPCVLTADRVMTILADSLDADCFNFVEMPGGCGTPLALVDDEDGQGYRDVSAIAAELGMPVLLVAKYTHEALDKLIVSHAFLKARGAAVMGTLTVECESESRTEPEAGMSLDQLGLTLIAATQTPYLGSIRFSPSISVPQVNQGNLIKMTSADVDLLLLMKALNLGLPLTH